MDEEENNEVDRIKEQLDKLSEASKFNVSMGEQTHSLEFADGFAKELHGMLNKTEEQLDQEDVEYRKEVYDIVRNSIDDNGEIVIYATTYLLDDYINKEGELVPEMYWELHKEVYEDDTTYAEFLEKYWDNIKVGGLASWDDIMILDDKGEETTLLTILSSDYCMIDYKEDLKQAIIDNDQKKENDIITEGPYNYATHDDFNDIIVKPKEHNTISHSDLVRAIRWFIRHRLKITDKYSIRYATKEEKDGGRETFVNYIKERIKEIGIEDEVEDIDTEEVYNRHSIEWYFGKYLAKDI